MKFSTLITTVFTFLFLTFSPTGAHAGDADVAACVSENSSCTKYYQITADCFKDTSSTQDAANGLSCICSKSGAQSAWEGCVKCIQDAGGSQTDFEGTWGQVCSESSGTGSGTSSRSTTTAASSSNPTTGSSIVGSKSSSGAQGIKYGSSYHVFVGLFVAAGMGFFGVGV